MRYFQGALEAVRWLGGRTRSGLEEWLRRHGDVRRAMARRVVVMFCSVGSCRRR